MSLPSCRKFALEQVVVAGHGRVLGMTANGLHDLLGGPERVLERLGWLVAAGAHDLRVAARDLEDIELGGEVQVGLVELAQAAGDRGHRLLLAQLLGGHVAARDEAGDQAGRLVEHGGHLRAEAQLGRPARGEPLGLAVDAEQVGVLAR